MLAKLFEKAIRYQIFSVFSVMFCSAAAILGSLNSPFRKVMIPLTLIGLILALIQKLGFQILNSASIRKKKVRKINNEEKEIEQLNQKKYPITKSYYESIKALNNELKSLKKNEANKDIISNVKKELKTFNEELGFKN